MLSPNPSEPQAGGNLGDMDRLPAIEGRWVAGVQYACQIGREAALRNTLPWQVHGRRQGRACIQARSSQSRAAALCFEIQCALAVVGSHLRCFSMSSLPVDWTGQERDAGGAWMLPVAFDSSSSLTDS